MRALPSVRDAAGTQPRILVYDDAGTEQGVDNVRASLRGLGYYEGTEYDVYSVRAPGSLHSNGLASVEASGATAKNLAGYHTILYLGGDKDVFLLSNGNPSDPGNDKTNDLLLLNDWRSLDGDRNIIYFGDALARFLSESSEGSAYLADQMSAEIVSPTSYPSLEDQGGWRIRPTVQFISCPYGEVALQIECPLLHRVDAVSPRTGSTAVTGHEFLQSWGAPPAGDFSASVLHMRSTVDGIKADAFFPFSVDAVHQPVFKRTLSDHTALSYLLESVFCWFGEPDAPARPDPTDNPQLSKASLRIFPNPFNPRTRVRYFSPTAEQGRIAIYNLRGERIRVLFDGMFSAGENLFDWNGSDNRGSAVASGVYFVDVTAPSGTQRHKVAIVR
jgi:hypothetical protein